MLTANNSFPKSTRLDIQKLRAQAEVLKVNKDGVIMLDRNNPSHVDWFEDKNS